MSIARKGRKMLRKSLRELSEDKKGQFVRVSNGKKGTPLDTDELATLAAFGELAIEATKDAFPLLVWLMNGSSSRLALYPKRGMFSVVGHEGSTDVRTPVRGGCEIEFNCFQRW